MEAVKLSLGAVKLKNLDRKRLIDFGRRQAKQVAGPATLAVDLSFIGTI